MLLDQISLHKDIENMVLLREQKKDDEEKRIYRTEIKDKIKKAVNDNLLTDCFTKTESPKPDVWFVDVKLDSDLYDEVNQDVIQSLQWMGLKAEIDKTDALLNRYAIIFEFDDEVDSDPQKRKELQKQGWDWSRLEKSKLQSRVKKAAEMQWKRLLKEIKTSVLENPRNRKWTIYPSDQLSRRLLDEITAAYGKVGYQIEESFEEVSEKGKEKETDAVELPKLKLTIHAPKK